MKFWNILFELLKCILRACVGMFYKISWMNILYMVVCFQYFWFCWWFQVLKGVLSCATQEVKDLYHLLEHEFLPLDLASKIQPLLVKISKLGGKLSSASSVHEVQLSQYAPALEKLATLRLLQQVHSCV